MVKWILKNPEVSKGWKIVVAPFVGLLYACSIGSVFWLNALYAAGMGILIPYLLAHIF